MSRAATSCCSSWGRRNAFCTRRTRTIGAGAVKLFDRGVDEVAQVLAGLRHLPHRLGHHLLTARQERRDPFLFADGGDVRGARAAPVVIEQVHWHERVARQRATCSTIATGTSPGCTK